VKRHAFDPLSFVFGLLFAGLAMFVLLGGSLGDLSPVLLAVAPGIAIGLLIVLYSARRIWSDEDRA
jgi:hypothetical protein